MRGQPNLRPLGDFLEDISLDRDDLVEDLLEYGCCYLIAGRYKTGKSIALLNLILVAAQCGLWLDRTVKAGAVVWFQLEDSARIIRRRWEKMGGFPTDDIRIEPGPWKATEENQESTIKTVDGASPIVVDPIIAASSVERWADMTEVRRTYDYWRVVARETNAVVVVSAHHRKMSGDDGDQVAGSHQAGAMVDGIIEMRRMGGDGADLLERRLSFTGRDWPDLEDLIVKLDPEPWCSGRWGLSKNGRRRGRRASRTNSS